MTPRWLRPGELHSLYGLKRERLGRWALKGCPPLGGRKLRYRPDPDHFGYRQYLVRDVMAAMAATQAPVEEFDDEGGHWVSAAVAASRDEFGRPSRPILYRWRKVGCPWLEGRKLRVRKRRFASSGTKKLYERWFFNSEELLAVARARSSSSDVPLTGQWLSAPQARHRFHFSKLFLQRCCRSRSVLLGGRGLCTELQRGTARGRFGTIASVRRVYLLADLEKLALQRHSGTTTQEETQWLTAREAKERFGFDEASLGYWRNRNCVYLDDRKLSARRPVSFTVDGRQRSIYQYFAPDLALIAKRRARPDDAVYQDKCGTWLPQRLAVRRAGVHAIKLIRWRKNNCQHLDGRKLRAQQVHLRLRRNKHGAVWVYHEDDLSQIADRRSGLGGAKASDRTLKRGGRIAARNWKEDSERAWEFVAKGKYKINVRELAKYLGCSPAHARKLPAYREVLTRKEKTPKQRQPRAVSLSAATLSVTAKDHRLEQLIREQAADDRSNKMSRRRV